MVLVSVATGLVLKVPNFSLRPSKRTKCWCLSSESRIIMECNIVNTNDIFNHFPGMSKLEIVVRVSGCVNSRRVLQFSEQSDRRGRSSSLGRGSAVKPQVAFSQVSLPPASLCQLVKFWDVYIFQISKFTNARVWAREIVRESKRARVR